MPNLSDPGGLQVSIAVEFGQISQQANATCSGNLYCVAALYTVLLAGVGIGILTSSYDPVRIREYEEYLEHVNEGRIPPVQATDDAIVVTLSPQLEQAIDDALRSPGPTESPDNGDDPTATPAPIPITTPTPGATCTPTPTDTPERVLFGQKRISPGFDPNQGLTGKTIYSLAQELRTGLISPQSIYLDVFEYTVQGSPVLVAVGNRRLAALSLAGFRPTTINRVPFALLPPRVQNRLTESIVVPGRFGVPNNTIHPPSEYTAVTESISKTALDDILDVVRVVP